jgi:superfamily II DNA helicase RecQ
MCFNYCVSHKQQPQQSLGADSPADEQAARSGDAMAVWSYLMNLDECRRVLLLRHFDEQFDSSQGALQCNNCAQQSEQLDVAVEVLTHGYSSHILVSDHVTLHCMLSSQLYMSVVVCFLFQ